jgi:hypothetical protein
MWMVRRITCVRTSAAGLRAATTVTGWLGPAGRSEYPASPAAMTAADAPASLL